MKLILVVKKLLGLVEMMNGLVNATTPDKTVETIPSIF